MKAFFLAFVLALSPCLYAELPTTSSQAIEDGESAPVNTRMCEYSLHSSATEETAEVCDTETLSEEVPQNAAESEQEMEIVAKFLYPGCYNQYQHYFFGPTMYALNSYTSEFLENGSYVVLRNGSVWKMAETDFWKIASWETSDRLQLSRNLHSHSNYPYVLRNIQTGEAIRVTVRVGPRYDSPLFRSCINVDIYSGNVWCNDGTIWWVPSADRAILATWNAHDVMMLGVNEDFTRLEYPYLLMNLSNGSCCHAAWLQ